MIPEAVLAEVGRARRILLTSHQNPDGDAIGTELGLARILRAAGREVAIWNYHPAPPVYRTLPGAETNSPATQSVHGVQAAAFVVVL